MSPAPNGATFERLNPDHRRGRDPRSRSAPSPTRRRAADAAAAAFPAWSRPARTQRRAMLLKAADLLAAKAPSSSKLMTAETGATAGWAGFNVHARRRHAARGGGDDHADRRRGDPVRQAGLARHGASRQPAGVVLGIAPWNAPVILGVRAVAMPLACGNTVVLKASEICPAHAPR